MFKRCAVTALLLLTGSVLAGSAQGAASLLGPPPNTTSATNLTLTTDASGAPLLAWIERAARWTGTRWQALGAVINETPTHNASQISAHTAPDGRLWLGWGEDSSGAHTDSYLLVSWSGSAWSDPLGALDRATASRTNLRASLAARPRIPEGSEKLDVAASEGEAF